MSVPEAAVDKYYSIVFWKNDIGFAGKVFYMQPVPESTGVQKTPHKHFGLCVLSLYAAHVVTAGLFIMYIGHTGGIFSRSQFKSTKSILKLITLAEADASETISGQPAVERYAGQDQSVDT